MRDGVSTRDVHDATAVRSTIANIVPSGDHASPSRLTPNGVSKVAVTRPVAASISAAL